MCTIKPRPASIQAEPDRPQAARAGISCSLENKKKKKGSMDGKVESRAVAKSKMGMGFPDVLDLALKTARLTAARSSRWTEETGRRRKTSILPQGQAPRLRPPLRQLTEWPVRSLLGAPLIVHAAALSGWAVAPPRCQLELRSRWSRCRSSHWAV